MTKKCRHLRLRTLLLLGGLQLQAVELVGVILQSFEQLPPQAALQVALFVLLLALRQIGEFFIPFVSAELLVSARAAGAR